MDMTPHFPIYMDYSATNPCDPRVVDAMIPWLREHFGNPASRTHAYGWEADEAVETARAQVAAILGATPREIVFTSGATESNNLAIAGVARFYKDKKDHIVTLVTEHKCVLDTCRHLELEGFKVTYMPVKKNGMVDLKGDGLKEQDGVVVCEGLIGLDHMGQDLVGHGLGGGDPIDHLEVVGVGGQERLWGAGLKGVGEFDIPVFVKEHVGVDLQEVLLALIQTVGNRTRPTDASGFTVSPYDAKNSKF